MRWLSLRVGGWVSGIASRVTFKFINRVNGETLYAKSETKHQRAYSEELQTVELGAERC